MLYEYQDDQNTVYFKNNQTDVEIVRYRNRRQLEDFMELKKLRTELYGDDADESILTFDDVYKD